MRLERDRWRDGLATAALLLVTASTGTAHAQAPAAVTLKGPIKGGIALLNPVWNEAKDPKAHRFTFRAPSTTVGKNAKRLTAYLPKELCIALLGDGAKASSTPIQMHVSGGRTNPVTLVVPDGQNVQFVNHDPFPHKLHSVKKMTGGLNPEPQMPTKPRTWKPPGPGTYEIRDELFPSIRSWIVVEPKAVAHGHPSLTKPNQYLIKDAPPGTYKMQGYFMGKPVGEALDVTVNPAPKEQLVRQPLVVGKPPKPKK